MKKLMALLLSVALVIGMKPCTASEACACGAVGQGIGMRRVCYPNITYRLQGERVDVDDLYVGDQWALYNDGSFVLESGANDHDVYNDPFGDPFGPGLWNDPFLDDFFDSYDSYFNDLFNDLFGYDDFFGEFFGGSMFGFSSRGRQNKSQTVTKQSAVEGVDINVAEAWKLYDRADEDETRPVIVALIDTGADISHEDLAGAFWTNSGEIPDNGIDDDGNGYIDDIHGWNFYDDNNRIYTGSNDDHGTHGAGTIAASTDNAMGIAGVAGNSRVKVMILKALGGRDGSGSTMSVIQAIRYAEANGASIVNLSLGTSEYDPLLHYTIASSDMLFVIAAGNNAVNSDRTPCYPASYDCDNIISVANVSFDGTLSGSSNYGTQTVDIAAPGTYIISTTPDNDYGYMSGTSMAAPFVTAAASLLYSYRPDISLADVKEIILSSARPLDTLQGKTMTGGMLDVSAALSYDPSLLTNSGFERREAQGSPTALTYSTYVNYGQTYITVNISDPDNDTYYLAYEPGEHDISHFRYGRGGTEFSRSGRSDSSTFRISESGNYTFYALDAQGHETVLVAYVEVEPRQNGNEDNGGRSGYQGRSNPYSNWFSDWDSWFFGDSGYGWGM